MDRYNRTHDKRKRGYSRVPMPTLDAPLAPATLQERIAANTAVNAKQVRAPEGWYSGECKS